MALELNTMPTFSERVAAADLAVVGTITGPVRVEAASGYEKPRIMGFFELQVEEALLGKPSGRVVLLRIVGDGSKKSPRWSTDIVAGTRMLLLLARDVSAGLPENLYTPYFSSAFPIDERGRIRLQADFLDDASRKALRPTRGVVTLARVRQTFAGAVRSREKRRRELEALIPRQRRGAYPEVLEAPWGATQADVPLGPFVAIPDPTAPEAGRDVELLTQRKPGPRPARKRSRNN